MRAIIVANGEIRPGTALTRALETPHLAGGAERDLVVAADGGALKALSLGLRPDVVIGDGDSLMPDTIDALRRDGVEVIVHPVEKNESDTELAVRHALSRGASSLVVVGAFGGARLEHSVANLLLLTLPELAGIDVALVDGPSTVRVMAAAVGGQVAISGEVGDFVSLLALSERVEGVTTLGMRFPLADETLLQGPTRGLSNELAAGRATVGTRTGRLAVIHTRRTEGPIDA